MTTCCKPGVSPLQALTLGLATARLTQLVVDDSLIEPVRAQIGARATTQPKPDGRLVVETPGQLAAIEPVPGWAFLDEIVNCHACTSVWAGAGVLLAGQTRVGRFLVRVLALSQAALVLKSVTERIER